VGTYPIASLASPSTSVWRKGDRSRTASPLLVVSVKTVETHRAHLMNKLGLQTRAELVHYVLREGYLTLEAGQT